MAVLRQTILNYDEIRDCYNVYINLKLVSNIIIITGFQILIFYFKTYFAMITIKTCVGTMKKLKFSTENFHEKNDNFQYLFSNENNDRLLIKKILLA